MTRTTVIIALPQLRQEEVQEQEEEFDSMGGFYDGYVEQPGFRYEVRPHRSAEALQTTLLCACP